jgi:glycosyltransferase involved in cell wall biosynthesis
VAELRLSDAVALPGFVLNRLDYLTRASLFVLSSEFEGYPNALVEAIACRAPVLSTDCGGGGARQILGPRHADLLVPVNDPEALSAGIVRQLSQPTARADLEAMSEHLSFGRTAEQFLALLRGSSDA